MECTQVRCRYNQWNEETHVFSLKPTILPKWNIKEIFNIRSTHLNIHIWQIMCLWKETKKQFHSLSKLIVDKSSVRDKGHEGARQHMVLFYFLFLSIYIYIWIFLFFFSHMFQLLSSSIPTSPFLSLSYLCRIK